MCSHTVDRGSGGMVPRNFFDKNGLIWCNMGRPKVYYQPKNQQFKEKNHQENLIAIFLSLYINLDEHVSTKINMLTINQGGLGANSPEAEEI